LLPYNRNVNLDGPELEILKTRAKRQLRQRARAVRSAIPRDALKLRSDAIATRMDVLPEIAAARSIALFWPMEDKNEVDLRAFGARCRERGVRVYYPISGESRDDSGFSQVEVERGRGFCEPAALAPRAAPEEIDVIVVPALAVSPSGHRLGYGAGFYDSVLPRYSPPALTVVVAYEFELLLEIPSLPHDVPCDVVVTDARTFRAGTEPEARGKASG
jgi:5-formyltetrahydrofolate cyclo-ligase